MVRNLLAYQVAHVCRGAVTGVADGIVSKTIRRGNLPRGFESHPLLEIAGQRVQCYRLLMPYSDPEQQRAYQNSWIQRRRREWVAANGPCVDCGTWDDLQVDHADAATKVTHRVWSWSASRRLTELAKCVVRCQRCHIIKTRDNAENWFPGELNGNAKLTAAMVREIHASSEPTRALARRFGVAPRTVRFVRQGVTWSSMS